MNDIYALARLDRWPFRIGKQFKKSHITLQLKAALVVHSTDNGHLFGVIFLDENVYLKVLVIPRITECDLMRQLSFRTTGSLNLGLDQRHSDHAVAFNPHRIA